MGVARSLLTAGAISFAYMLIRAISFIVLFWVIYRIFDSMTQDIDIPEELRERNIALGIIIAALALGLAYIIGQM